VTNNERRDERKRKIKGAAKRVSHDQMDKAFIQRRLVDLLLRPAYPYLFWHNWRILGKDYWKLLTKNLPENVRE
jgi:hypothetical protein